MANYRINAYDKSGRAYGVMVFSGYTRREAERQYRRHKLLKNKRLNLYIGQIGAISNLGR